MARQFTWVKIAAIAVALAVAVATALFFTVTNSACRTLVVPPPVVGEPAAPRALPRKFPRDSNLPPTKEVLVSGPIDLSTFNPTQDIVRFERLSVWFESDLDEVREEDDHLVHRSLRAPLDRVARLVEANGGRLKIHDAYRPKGIHKANSLHREGRAVDLTCEGLSLSQLAKLCWVAGFDWVLYEAPRKGGEHVHCSVKR